MEKMFYTAKDISKILGYSLPKSYSIIKQLNIELLKEAEKENKQIVIFNGRISKDYFHKKVGLN